MAFDIQINVKDKKTQNKENNLEELIVIPKHPLWDITKDFGKGQMVAVPLGIAGSLIAGIVANQVPSLMPYKEEVITAGGLILQKFGFYPGPIIEEYLKNKNEIHYLTHVKGQNLTSKEKRKRYLDGLKIAFNRGTINSIKDLGQDAFYTPMMYVILKLGNTTDPLIVSAVSTASNMIASFGTSSVHHGINEVRYELLKNKFKRAGFGIDSYYESRIKISDKYDSRTILDAISKEFNLSDYEKWHYSDTNIQTSLKKYSNREPKLRLRYRENESKTTQCMTAQVVYKRAAEITQKQMSQVRCFTIKKDKIYYVLNPETDVKSSIEYAMPESIENIEQEKARKLLLKNSNGVQNSIVEFDRYKTHSKETIMTSIDEITNTTKSVNGFGKRFLEFKTKDDLYTLKEAIKYVLTNFPDSQQTTHEKDRALEMK